MKLEFGGKVLDKELFANPSRADPTTGSKTYGVLLGRRDPPGLRVLAFRQLDVDLAHGEVDPQSEGGRRAFAGLMAKLRWDPQLSGLQPVGWFRSDLRGDLNLTSPDLEVFNQFFRLPWQIGAVVQTGPPMRARFFLREPDGSLLPATAFRDVSPAEKSDAPILLERGPRTVPAFAPQNHVAARVGPRPPLTRAPLWAGSVFLAALITFGAWWVMRPPEDGPTSSRQHHDPVPDANRMAATQAEALWKKWEDEAKRQAPAQPPLELPDADLLPPAKLPDLIEDKSEAPIEDKAREARSRDGKRVRKAEADRSNSNAVQRRQIVIPRPSKGGSVPQLEAPPVVRTRDTEPLAQSAGVFPLEISGPALPGPNRPSVTPPPATSVSTPAISRAGPSVQKPAAPAGPTTGRLIWTGRLRKNEYVVFDGSKPSVGSASGALPGRPVELAVSPGNLTKSGMVVYSVRVPAANHSREAASAQNGWNPTQFEWDPERAHDVEIVEAPGPNNGWKRLVLRSKSQRDSVILVEWKALAQ